MTSEPLSAAVWRMARAHQPLPAAEQRRLIRLAARGDEDATEALILTNLRFIIAQAMRIGRGQHVDALVQAGMVGMLEAIRRYRPAKANGHSPMSYAGYWIVLHIVTELGAMRGGAVRVPRRLMKAYRYGHLDDVERAGVEGALSAPASLVAHDASVPAPDSAVHSRLDAAALMEHLGDRDQQIVRMRFMDEMTPSEIGRCFRMTRQRVDQIVDDSLARMRRAAAFAPQVTAWLTATATR